MGRGVAMRRGRQRRKESAEEGRECTRRMTGVSAPVLSEACMVFRARGVLLGEIYCIGKNGGREEWGLENIKLS